MKFLVDAQLPPALPHWLREAGHEAQAVREVGLREADDSDIWRQASATGAIIVTKDEDFASRAQREGVFALQHLASDITTRARRGGSAAIHLKKTEESICMGS